MTGRLLGCAGVGVLGVWMGVGLCVGCCSCSVLGFHSFFNCTVIFEKFKMFAKVSKVWSKVSELSGHLFFFFEGF